MDHSFKRWGCGFVLAMFAPLGVLAAILAHQDNLHGAFWWLISGFSLLTVIGILWLIVVAEPWRWFAAAPPASPNADQQTDITILLGEWSVTKPDLIQKWIFSPDGIVISDKGGAITKGTWKLEESCVRINWSSLNLRTRAHHWATLKRPLKPEGTKGDAWDGPDLIWAEKL